MPGGATLENGRGLIAAGPPRQPILDHSYNAEMIKSVQAVMFGASLALSLAWAGRGRDDTHGNALFSWPMIRRFLKSVVTPESRA